MSLKDLIGSKWGAGILAILVFIVGIPAVSVIAAEFGYRCDTWCAFAASSVLLALVVFMRWMLSQPRWRPFITRSANPARDALVALSLFSLVVVPCGMVVASGSCVPCFAECPGTSCLVFLEAICEILTPVTCVAAVLAFCLYITWGCRLIRTRAVDRIFILRIVWVVLNAVFVMQLFAGSANAYRLISGRGGASAPWTIVKAYVAPFAWYALVVGYLCLFTKRVRAIFWACTLLGAVGLFALGYAAMMSHWFWVGALLFVVSGVEYIRSLPLGENLSQRWHLLDGLVLTVLITGGVISGWFRITVDGSPYRHSIRVNDAVMDLGACMKSLSSRSQRWLFGMGPLNRPAYEECSLLATSTDDWQFVDALDFVDVDDKALRAKYLEKWCGAWSNVAEKVRTPDMFIGAAVARARKNIAASSWATFIMGVNGIEMGGAYTYPELRFLAVGHAVGALDIGALIKGIQFLSPSRDDDYYSYATIQRDGAVLAGLRQVGIRELGNLEDQQLQDIRKFVRSRVDSVDVMRVQAMALTFWTLLEEYDASRERWFHFRNELISHYQSYHACQLFEPRIRSAVEECERAKKECRKPCFGKPELWPEFVVTTVADAYAALDLAFAVEQYRRAKGALPESLETLVPAFTDKVPACLADGSPFAYEKGNVEMMKHERCPDEYAAYRMKDSDGNPITHFNGYRISFKYARAGKGGTHFTVPVMCK